MFHGLVEANPDADYEADCNMLGGGGVRDIEVHSRYMSKAAGHQPCFESLDVPG